MKKELKVNVLNNILIENNILLIIRGVSGSGKSTFADFLQSMIPDCEIEICTADDYHMVNGEYIFKVENLSKAHAWCQKKAFKAIDDNVRLVIVNNTSTSVNEYKHYENYARKNNYQVVSIVMENLNEHKNVHNVPDIILKKQKNKLINSLKI